MSQTHECSLTASSIEDIVVALPSSLRDQVRQQLLELIEGKALSEKVFILLKDVIPMGSPVEVLQMQAKQKSAEDFQKAFW